MNECILTQPHNSSSSTQYNFDLLFWVNTNTKQQIIILEPQIRNIPGTTNLEHSRNHKSRIFTET